ncbi:carbamoyl phosphate synthase large subunit [Aureimonas sp. SA4125]|uniref:ATP-grasp domain-containing protein n=1 Tax=Aureimonas sp. SA4125 TaxID=2826993 RepID=UPI001CC77EEF|nr:ATP-grasp domain-containing protein [Aureimonas sp. SA4125]BDA82941.1 carbamoyl phosphate synthase large subunit [Aureimonas sp. SA4125]
MKRICVLVTSAGRRVGLLQCFRQSAHDLGIDLRIVACDVEPEASAACRMADEAVKVPACDDPHYIDALLAIVRREGVCLVVPTIDPELGPLSESLDRFAALGARVHVSASDVVAVCRDKLQTARVLERAGVPVPLTVALAEADDTLPWPMMMKPVGGSASRGIRVVAGRSEVPESTSEPMVLQQLLAGPEFTINIFVDRTGRLRAVVPHRRLRVRAGEVEKGRTERDAAFGVLAEGLLRAFPSARGALCFQAILDETVGLRVFEINARFGGGYPLAHHAGAEFTRWLIEEVADLADSANDGWREGVTMLRYDAAVFHG